MPYRTCVAYPENSCPSVIGVASIRWVRPALTTSRHSSALRSSAAASTSRPGSRLLDHRLGGGDVDGGGEDVVGGLGGVDVVVGVHGAAQPGAGEVGDHLVGVHVRGGAGPGLEHVDREVGVVPAVDDLLRRGRDRVRDVLLEDPEPALAMAAARLTCPRAAMWCGERPRPEIGKFSTARWVWADQRASRGPGPPPWCRARCGSPRPAASLLLHSSPSTFATILVTRPRPGQITGSQGRRRPDRHRPPSYRAAPAAVGLTPAGRRARRRPPHAGTP